MDEHRPQEVCLALWVFELPYFGFTEAEIEERLSQLSSDIRAKVEKIRSSISADHRPLIERQRSY